MGQRFGHIGLYSGFAGAQCPKTNILGEGLRPHCRPIYNPPYPPRGGLCPVSSFVTNRKGGHNLAVPTPCSLCAYGIAALFSFSYPLEGVTKEKMPIRKEKIRPSFPPPPPGGRGERTGRSPGSEGVTEPLRHQGSAKIFPGKIFFLTCYAGAP